MSSEVTAWVSRVIQEISQLLSEEALAAACDAPIHSAADTFQCQENEGDTHIIFLEKLSSFIQHIYAHGWTPRQHLTMEQARAEAIQLLRDHYNGRTARGYEAAYLDALNPTFNGVEFILAQLTQILVEKARDQYVRWVIHSRINSLTWSARCRMADDLIRKWQFIDPGVSKKFKPAQMADYCTDLLLAQISSEAQASKLFSRPKSG